MACMFVASLAVSGCAPGSDEDGELTVGVIDGFVQPAGSVACAEFHQHAETSGREESSHARRTLETMRPGLEAVCSAPDGAATATARLHTDDEIAEDLTLDVATSEATVHVTSDVAELDCQSAVDDSSQGTC